MTIANASAAMGMAVILIGGGIAWQQAKGQAARAEKKADEIGKTHRDDTAKIVEYIEETKAKRREDEANLRALCATKRLDRLYCQTRGFTYGAAE
jgi:hypothetical protein